MASPRPAPRDERDSSPRQKRSNILSRASNRVLRPYPRRRRHLVSAWVDEDDDCAVGRRVMQGIREEVHENAFNLVRRKEGGDVLVDVGVEANMPASCFCLDALERARHDGCDGSRRSSRVRTPVSMRASSKRSSTRTERTRTCSRSTGTYSSGAARSSSIASSIACMFARGVRRSWLAHVTSSRRVSKRRRRLSPISLNDAASSATSVGPARVRARRDHRVRARRTHREPSRSSHDRACQDERRDDCGKSRRGRNRENLHVFTHVEHHPAGKQHRS